MPPDYVDYFVECLAGIEGSAQIMSYVDADLGALDRGLSLVDSIIAAGYDLSGARCLDIGCSNGAPAGGGSDARRRVVPWCGCVRRSFEVGAEGLRGQADRSSAR